MESRLRIRQIETEQVSLLANSRYLEALALIDDPTNATRELDRMTSRKQDTAGRGCAGFSPLARQDAELFASVMDGDHCLRGLTNQDVRQRLAATPHLRQCAKNPKKASATISRIFRRPRAHALIGKIPNTRRWRVTRYYGRRVMGAVLNLRHHDFPHVHLHVAP